MALKKVLRLKTGIDKNINEFLATIFLGGGDLMRLVITTFQEIFILKNARKNILEDF